jgi:hypothetical protein
MADRTSAEIFGRVFNYLAKSPQSQERDNFAKFMYKATNDYDFDQCQMGCDKALVALGLAKHGINPRYPEDGEVVIYE